MKKLAKYLFLVPMMTGMLLSSCSGEKTAASMKGEQTLLNKERLEDLVKAPEFPLGLDWLNTDKPLSMEGLRGKIVLIDFWTYCCINCIHVLEDLKRLEDKYPEELVVVGVHSAKFENEKETGSIRQAILRYDIKHPVVNDPELILWRQYGVRAWPTLVLINPRGRVIRIQSGEDIFDLFDALIRETIQYFEARGELVRSPLDLALEEASKPQSLLSFPGKIKADPASNRLVITDSNHHRIVVTTSTGEILDIIGSGREGNTDGDFETAEFDHPQGTFLKGDRLYIADTENHLVRLANLKTRQVTTILGNGTLATRRNQPGRGTGLSLNSPWDLLIHENRLYIAMAGAHQIWKMDLETFRAQPYAGTGVEALIDGPLGRAALAQPSGITADNHRLYFADSEVSSVRSADLHPRGNVETIIGEDLFEFGDVDGSNRVARLQHPLGAVYHDSLLYVADTYNSKIKVVDPVKKTSHTLAGTGKHGNKDAGFKEAAFFEPAGITVLDDKLYVADTNNHRIRVLDLKGERVSTLAFSGVEKLAKRRMEIFRGRIVNLQAQTVRAGKGWVAFSVNLPGEYKFTTQAPSNLMWKSSDPQALDFQTGEKAGVSGPIEFPYRIAMKAKSGGDSDLTFDAVVYYCRKDSTLCLFERVQVVLPVSVTDTGQNMLRVTVDLQPKG